MSENVVHYQIDWEIIPEPEFDVDDLLTFLQNEHPNILKEYINRKVKK